MFSIVPSFMQSALVASLLIGVSCGYLSVYVILKRLVFLAIALAQFASAAVAISLFFSMDSTMATLAAFIGVLIGALFFSWPGLGRFLPRENAIGTGYALASAVGIILIANNAQGETHLLNLLYGDVLTVTHAELWVMSGVMLVAGFIYLRYAREFLFTSFDAEMAKTVGIRTRLWEVLFYVTLGSVIAMAIRLGGMMLVFALLVLPGYAALLARCRIRQAFAWAVIMAVVAGVAGLLLSFYGDKIPGIHSDNFHWDTLPASAITIAVLGAMVIISVIVNVVKGRHSVTRRSQRGRAFHPPLTGA